MTEDVKTSSKEEKTSPEQQKFLNQLHLGHLGTIFSNLAIVCVIIGLSTVMSFLFTALFFVVEVLIIILMFMAIILTLGIILAVIPSYWNALKSVIASLSSGGEILEKINSFLIRLMPYLMPIAIACAVASIVFLTLDKTKKHTSRLVLSYITAIVAILVLILIIVGGLV